MKVSFSTVASLLAASAAAYPQVLNALPAADARKLKDWAEQGKQSAANPQVAAASPGTLLSRSFSPQGWSTAQRIGTTGLHAWRAPGPTDDRGPCPGLNALANHGYISRSGRASIVEFIAATTSVFGMGPILAIVLAVYGAAIDGVVLGWSIGGGIRTGIGGSHGNYETDNSPIRGDLFQYGSNSGLIVNQFQRFVDLQPNDATANYNIDVLTQFRAQRFRESIEKNPHFYYGPFSGTIVSAAAYSFIFRFFANHTEANPAGELSLNVLKSFMSVTGERGNFTWVPGHERIPNNWYRRAFGDAYEVFGVAEDAGTFADVTPGVSSPGCNQGTVNSYVDISSSYQDFDFSGLGSVCFAVGAVLGVTSNVPVVGNLVNELILPIQNTIGCSTVPSRNDTVAEVCPGYTYYGGPTAPVAPGAIQS